MMRAGSRVAFAIVGMGMAGTSVSAQATANSLPFNPAVGIELWASTDSDKTDVLKLLGRALWDFEGRDKYAGLAFEQAWFRPQGQHVRKQTRVYLDAADELSRKWRWQARIGTNGKTVLGSATVRAADWSNEFFVEREVVETPQGLDHGIYYTFIGASADLPAGKRGTFNVMAGYQAFTGDNERLHLRASYVHVVDQRHGLSIQLRGRYFHSTQPGEFDYYSPRNFLSLTPVLQMRRFDHAGWMYVAAIGYGAQRATGTSWQAARMGDLRIESPVASHNFHLFGQLQYSNSSLTGAAANYHYIVARVGVTASLN